MAGETQKSTAKTNRDSGKKRAARLAHGRKVVAMDHHQFAAASELEAADNLIMDIQIPSNAIVTDVAIYNDDMDSGTTLALDFGVAAAVAHESVTSGAVTKHAKDEIIDSDLFVDGDTTARAATAKFTSLDLDAGTSGPDDALKPVHERLGYDEDPSTMYNLVVQSQAAATGLSAAADFVVKVEYVVD